MYIHLAWSLRGLSEVLQLSTGLPCCVRQICSGAMMVLMRTVLPACCKFVLCSKLLICRYVLCQDLLVYSLFQP